MTAALPANVNQTAAVEFCLGMISRAFMLAEPYPAVPALTPQVKSMMARQLLAQGNAVFEIGIDMARRRRQSRLSLRPVAAYSIMGDAEPASWRYSFKQQRPNGDNPLKTDELPARNVSYEGMVHVRYMPPHDAPWRGDFPAGEGWGDRRAARQHREKPLDGGATS